MFCLEKLIIYMLDTHEISESRSSINVYTVKHLTLTSRTLSQSAAIHKTGKKSMLNVLFSYLHSYYVADLHIHTHLWMKTILCAVMMFIKFYALFLFFPSSSHLTTLSLSFLSVCCYCSRLFSVDEEKIACFCCR